VSERVARWLSSLSAKYIAVFVLLVAVPVICTSVYLLSSSYRDNKRALVRLQQEKAKSVAVTIERYFADRTKRMQAIDAQYLSFTARARRFDPCSKITQPVRSTSTVPGARHSRARAAGSPWSRGTSHTIAR
jgi:hypothetical protein